MAQIIKLCYLQYLLPARITFCRINYLNKPHMKAGKCIQDVQLFREAELFVHFHHRAWGNILNYQVPSQA